MTLPHPTPRTPLSAVLSLRSAFHLASLPHLLLIDKGQQRHSRLICLQLCRKFELRKSGGLLGWRAKKDSIESTVFNNSYITKDFNGFKSQPKYKASILPLPHSHSPPFALPFGTSSKSPTHAAWQQIQYLKDILLSPKRQIRNIYQTSQTPREANKKKEQKKSESRSKRKSWSKSESDRGKRSKTIYNNSFSFTWTWTWTWNTPTVQTRPPPVCKPPRYVELLNTL